MDVDGWPVVIDAVPHAEVSEALFDDLVDYAGLFPPASLSMATAVGEYRVARRSADARRLDRFVCLGSRLQELAAELLGSEPDTEAWSISVILDGPLESMAGSIAGFHEAVGTRANVAMVERRLQLAPEDSLAVALAEADATVRKVLSAVPSAITMFEVAPKSGKLDGDTARLGVAVLAELRQNLDADIGAKLRCGGVEAADFPSLKVVAQFIAACVEHDLPFKATAGLHHPVRHFDRSLGVMRHGFLNLLVATGVAQRGAGVDTLITTLRHTDAGQLIAAVKAFDPSELRGQFISYGSCDFAEPMADLAALGLVST